MQDNLFSPSWYRVASLQPRLRGHVHVDKHIYRGETWYVLHDRAKGRHYRFNPSAYAIIGRMDGVHDVQRLWEDASNQLGDDAPTQPEVVQLLSQLHSADLLLCDVPPHAAEILRRASKVQKSRWLANLRSPMAMRIPLFDPDRFLTRTIGWVRPWLGLFGALIWLAVVGMGVSLAGTHWSELTSGMADRVLTAQNLVLLWCVFPVVKAFHELGHAYAVKAWGGEVHETGVMFLVLSPIPYVDASSASEFRSPLRRAAVGAAGMAVELFLAALALLFWVAAEPGLPRAIAYNVILIASVSTVVFNGNPLLRYDGYYILSDLIGMPNLAQRGIAYVGYLLRRYVLGSRHLEAPHTTAGERVWLVAYTILAFIYRAFVYVGIILFLAGKFFVVGVVLAIWAGFAMVVLPLVKGLRFLATNADLREHRFRSWLVASGSVAALAAFLFLLPLPHRTRAEGVVWVPEDALVRAASDGFVEELRAAPGASVARGDLLVVCGNPILAAEAKVQRARLEETRARYDAAAATDIAAARMLAKEVESVHAEVRRADQRIDDLAVRSPSPGRFMLPRPQDLPGRYLRRGDLVGYVLGAERPIVRVVVGQADVDLVRHSTGNVTVRLADRFDVVIPGVVEREVPAAEERLPSPALGSVGGGAVAIDPTKTDAARGFEKLFQFDVRLAATVDPLFVGGRAWVRFEHGNEPLAPRIYRTVRRLFLGRFHV